MCSEPGLPQCRVVVVHLDEDLVDQRKVLLAVHLSSHAAHTHGLLATIPVKNHNGDKRQGIRVEEGGWRETKSARKPHSMEDSPFPRSQSNLSTTKSSSVTCSLSSIITSRSEPASRVPILSGTDQTVMLYDWLYAAGTARRLGSGSIKTTSSNLAVASYMSSSGLVPVWNRPPAPASMRMRRRWRRSSSAGRRNGRMTYLIGSVKSYPDGSRCSKRCTRARCRPPTLV
mmetsp:Transcript_35/g.89  ORF Transcript_35/g.89 Transcript_35/m.89 type:complete len:229 (-) Transcript_35:982-1668(-)